VALTSPSQTADSTKELFDAVAANDVERIRRAVAAGASPDARHSYTMHERFEEPYEVVETALYAALNWKKEGAALELLALGASPDNGGAQPPLPIAVERGLAAAVKALLERSPKPEALVAALQAAAASGNDEIAGQLLAAGATPTTRALCTACGGGARDLAIRLLDAGVDARSTDGPTIPLVQAAWSGNVGLVQTLLERGADLARDGGEALFHAANAGRRDMVAALLALGVPPDQPNHYAWTPLMTAAWQDQPEVARLLLAAGANPAHRDGSGKSVLDWARESRQRLVVPVLEGWRS
jgi:ankyrin repeat protein